MIQPEKYHITPHPNGGRGFKMSLINGEVDVPDTPGAYVVSTGCGSGKTECAKSIIRHKYNSGVLYCVDTRAELAKMYDWILDNLCTPGGQLQKEDVFMITSDEQSQDYKVMLREYQAHPELLMRKKVLLLTHVRFWSDLIDYFLIFTDAPYTDTFTGDFETLMKRGDLRKYVIFDETPTFIKPFVNIPKPILGNFCTRDRKGVLKAKSSGEMLDYYNTFVKGTSGDFYKTKNKLTRNKVDTVLGMLPHELEDWNVMKKDSLSISFTPMMLCQKDMQTHILILEGAGDVLFCGSKKYNVIDVPEKYHSKIILQKFDFPLVRKRYEQIDLENFHSFTSWLSEHIERSEGKVLVVVWKTQGIKTKKEENDIDDSSASEFVNRVQTQFEAKGLSSEKYSITYYGANDTKSTNLYRDYQEIVLCGTWHIPGTYKFRRDFCSMTSEEEHLFWYYIQLISRIGIRKNDGQTYNVVLSNDHPEKFFDALDKYFNDNYLDLKSKDNQDPDWIRIAKEKGIGKIMIGHISNLIAFRPGLKDAIEQSEETTISVSLKDLNEITGLKKKKAQGFLGLKKNLAKLGIELIIEKGTKK